MVEFIQTNGQFIGYGGITLILLLLLLFGLFAHPTVTCCDLSRKPPLDKREPKPLTVQKRRYEFWNHARSVAKTTIRWVSTR